MDAAPELARAEDFPMVTLIVDHQMVLGGMGAASREKVVDLMIGTRNGCVIKTITIVGLTKGTYIHYISRWTHLG